MKEVECIRQRSHQLTEPVFDRPSELVAWMGAVQAQDYTMTKWALGVRLKGGSLRTVEEAMQQGEIVRTHILRPTWHWVPGEDLRWMLQLSSERVRKAIDGWTRGCGLDIPESVYTRCNILLEKILAGRCFLTREEIGREVERAGIPVADDRTRRYLLRAELEGIVCSGGDKAGKPTYALLDEQVEKGRLRSRQEALAELAARYFRSHSPAGIQDFVWWSGLTLTEARQAVEELGGKLVKELFGGQEFWIHESCRTEPAGELHFLPPYDEYLIGYKDRSSVLNTAYFPKAFNRWGIFYPVVCYRGRIVAGWNRTIKGGKVSFKVEPFAGEKPVPERKWKEAVARYSAFYSLESVTPVIRKGEEK